MKQKASDSQTLLDIAVQHCGAWEAVTDIAALNGMSPSEKPQKCMELNIPDASYNRTMQQYCTGNGVKPATQSDAGEVSLHTFSRMFGNEFE